MPRWAQIMPMPKTSTQHALDGDPAVEAPYGAPLEEIHCAEDNEAFYGRCPRTIRRTFENSLRIRIFRHARSI